MQRFREQSNVTGEVLQTLLDNLEPLIGDIPNDDLECEAVMELWNKITAFHYDNFHNPSKPIEAPNTTKQQILEDAVALENAWGDREKLIIFMEPIRAKILHKNFTLSR
jgi:hypothetical protein